MSAISTKTPAMVLQEFTVKYKYNPPEFDLIYSKNGTHENEFKYQVIVANITAIGVGRSKQVAKHDAAHKALEKLSDLGLYKAEEPIKEFNSDLHRNEPLLTAQPIINCIGTLQEICAEHKIPLPVFIEISDVGPPHCREFTYECKVASIKTQATANTKKQAKQLCAREMLGRVKDVLPELTIQVDKDKKSLTTGEDVIDLYKEFSDFSVVPNKTVLVENFSLTILKIMKEKSLTIDDFSQQFLTRDESSFDYILDQLGIKYSVIIIQALPLMMFLSLNIDTPFTVCGIGHDEDSAKMKAIGECFKILHAYMQPLTI